MRSWEVRASWGQLVCSSETHRVALAGPRRVCSHDVTIGWPVLYFPPGYFQEEFRGLCDVLGRARTTELGDSFRCWRVNEPRM